MNDEKWYAVVDAAALTNDFFTLLQQENAPNSCLFFGSLDAEIRRVAPYLVQVTPAMKTWLDQQVQKSWGYYLLSNANLITLRTHLRHYLYVMLPTKTESVLFRFYDPRVIWKFLAVLDDWSLHQFMGPINKIMTLYPQKREESFTQIRSQFPSEMLQNDLMLTLTAAQYQQLQAQELAQFQSELTALLENEYQIQHSKLAEKTLFRSDINPNDKNSLFSTLATQLIAFCQRYEIDEQSTKIVAKLMIEHGIYHIDALPANWRKRLTNPNATGFYNVKVLSTLLAQGEEVR